MQAKFSGAFYIGKKCVFYPNGDIKTLCVYSRLPLLYINTHLWCNKEDIIFALQKNVGVSGVICFVFCTPVLVYGLQDVGMALLSFFGDTI